MTTNNRGTVYLDSHDCIHTAWDENCYLFYCLDKSVANQPNVMIFGKLMPEKI